jgi:hypothetical protein
MLRLRTIKSFKCRKTEQGQHVAAFSGFKRQAEKRLGILDAADTLEALGCLTPVTGRDNTAFASINNGVRVLRGTKVRTMWKSWIITKCI